MFNFILYFSINCNQPALHSSSIDVEIFVFMDMRKLEPPCIFGFNSVFLFDVFSSVCSTNGISKITNRMLSWYLVFYFCVQKAKLKKKKTTNKRRAQYKQKKNFYAMIKLWKNVVYKKGIIRFFQPMHYNYVLHQDDLNDLSQRNPYTIYFSRILKCYLKKNTKQTDEQQKKAHCMTLCIRWTNKKNQYLKTTKQLSFIGCI